VHLTIFLTPSGQNSSWKSQGHIIKENAFEQDNASAILLESNGNSSAGRPSQHIDIR
jgi:hypothetical protein